MTGDDNHQWLFVGRPPANLSQKTHGRGRVGECRQPSLVQTRQQQTTGDPNAFGHIIIRRFAVFLDSTLALGEADDQPWSDFEERLFRIGPERGEGGESFLACAGGVEFPLFFLRREPDCALRFTRGHGSEMPGLVIGTRWRGSSGADRIFDNLARDLLIRKSATGVTSGQALERFTGAGNALFVAIWR